MDAFKKKKKEKPNVLSLALYGPDNIFIFFGIGRKVFEFQIWFDFRGNLFRKRPCN